MVIIMNELLTGSVLIVAFPYLFSENIYRWTITLNWVIHLTINITKVMLMLISLRFAQQILIIGIARNNVCGRFFACSDVIKAYQDFRPESKVLDHFGFIAFLRFSVTSTLHHLCYRSIPAIARTTQANEKSIQRAEANKLRWYTNDLLFIFEALFYFIIHDSMGHIDVCNLTQLYNQQPGIIF